MIKPKRLLKAFLFSSLLGCALSGCGSDFTEAATVSPSQPAAPTAISQILKQDILINADLWDTEPRMLAAGLGFTEIIGVDGLDVTQPEVSENLVREAGGTWNMVDCPSDQVSLDNFTSAITPQQVANTFGYPVVRADGLPVEFTWPVRPSTLDPTDFVVILNNGERVQPEVCSISPNLDYNERAVVVLFGFFGNRLSPNNPDSVYPIRVEVVEDGTPLQLVGPGPTFVSAVGMGVDSGGSPYTDPDVPPEERGGPRLVASKLTVFSAEGDQAPAPFAVNSPNDGRTLYGDDAQYRIRVFTSGGFSPDGVKAMLPTEFSRYFKLKAQTAGGVVELTETGIDYNLDGATVRIVGLAELGKVSDHYDDCYTEDQDNQIDIILAGDEAAMRKITHVVVPSVAPYSPLYNPGGPGNDPTPLVRYSAPSPPHEVSVLMAIDDPMTVTFIDPTLEGNLP